MERYKRIQIEEREEIMKGVVGGKSLREIASKLNRNVSSISREIKRNKKGRKGNNEFLFLIDSRQRHSGMTKKIKTINNDKDNIFCHCEKKF